MNWKKTIGDLLGKFWTFVFGDNEFVQALRGYLSIMGRTQQNIHDKNIDSLTISTYKDSTGQDMLPYPIYLLKTRTTITTNDGTATAAQTNEVVYPAVDWGYVFSGTAEALAERDDTAGKLAGLKYRIPEPVFITDHAVGGKHMLFAGADYEYSEDGILFHFDLDDAKLFDTVVITDSTGAVCTWYKAFGWAKPESLGTDMVDAIYSDKLGPYSDIVWDMHVNGATIYNTKQLLCAVTESVVCEADGAIDHIWTEQGYTCILVGDKVYSSKQPANFDHGDNVKQGDILFGSLQMYTGKDDLSAVDASMAPAIKVRTDVGALKAKNEATNPDTITVDGETVYCLPLRTDTNDASAAYKERCAELYAEAAPSVSVPSTSFNPFQFVMNKLRHGRSVLAMMVCPDVSVISAALDAIRKSIVASGMLTVYLRGQGQTVDVPVSFTASCGNGAVATAATAKVVEIAAKASVII